MGTGECVGALPEEGMLREPKRGAGSHGAVGLGVVRSDCGTYRAAQPRSLCPSAKPGYCHHISEVESPLDEDCSSCHKNTSCSHCAGDADCPGATKCCPGKCGHMCQEPVLGEGQRCAVCGGHGEGDELGAVGGGS